MGKDKKRFPSVKPEDGSNRLNANEDPNYSNLPPDAKKRYDKMTSDGGPTGGTGIGKKLHKWLTK